MITSDDEAIEAVSARPRRLRHALLRRPSRRVVATALVGMAIVAATIVGVRGPTHRALLATDVARSSTPITPAALEDRYGVRIDLAGLTALGGLVELRFTVLDKDKATPLFHSDDAAPALAVESTGAVLRQQPGMAHKLTLLDGASYFMLYANASNAVREGTRVSVVIDKVRLEHVVVKQ